MLADPTGGLASAQADARDRTGVDLVRVAAHTSSASGPAGRDRPRIAGRSRATAVGAGGGAAAGAAAVVAPARRAGL